MKLPTINLGREALQRFNDVIGKEWLITNGLGGYASSTVLGVNTRKYHGLLVAALHPPGDRTVCLAKLDEEAIVGGKVYGFNANEFQGKIFPEGYLSLKEFSVSPFPRCVYAADGVEMEKRIFTVRGKNAVAAVYKILTGNEEARIRIYPLLNFRHFHSVTDRRISKVELRQESSCSKEVTVQHPKATIIVRATEGEFTERPVWIDRLFYREEDVRGESSLDDCYQPGYFEVQVPPKQRSEFAIVAAADESRKVAVHVLSTF